MLCPILDSSVQERCGAPGTGPVEGYDGDYGTATSLLGGKADRAGPGLTPTSVDSFALHWNKAFYVFYLK